MQNIFSIIKGKKSQFEVISTQVVDQIQFFLNNLFTQISKVSWSVITNHSQFLDFAISKSSFGVFSQSEFVEWVCKSIFIFFN